MYPKEKEYIERGSLPFNSFTTFLIDVSTSKILIFSIALSTNSIFSNSPSSVFADLSIDATSSENVTFSGCDIFYINQGGIIIQELLNYMTR